MLNPQTIEASSSHPVVEKMFCMWIRHNICLVLERNIVMTWMKSPQIMIIMLILCNFPCCFIVWLHCLSLLFFYFGFSWPWLFLGKQGEKLALSWLCTHGFGLCRFINIIVFVYLLCFACSNFDDMLKSL